MQVASCPVTAIVSAALILVSLLDDRFELMPGLFKTLRRGIDTVFASKHSFAVILEIGLTVASQPGFSSRIPRTGDSVLCSRRSTAWLCVSNYLQAAQITLWIT